MSSIGSAIERYAIIGTAPSYIQTPWQDPTLVKASLNDAYALPGVVADEWVDLHPMDHFFYPPDAPDGKRGQVFEHQVPFGYYVRPKTHLNWLATQQIPRWLHPDHAAQVPASATWPNVHAFPRDAVQERFGMYFGSTPAWMLAHAILRGAKEIHIYGIHLATESEYIEQRPNFEFLIGCVLWKGKRRVTVGHNLRRYETTDGLVVLPESSPILQAKHQYAFEPSPRRALAPLRWELHKAQTKRERMALALMARQWWNPIATVEEPGETPGETKTRRAWPSTLQRELKYYDALVGDCHEQLQRASAGIV